jgi:hypothetical protein
MIFVVTAHLHPLFSDISFNRGAFIDQSQSLNLFVSEPNFAKVLTFLPL